MTSADCFDGSVEQLHFTKSLEHNEEGLASNIQTTIVVTLTTRAPACAPAAVSWVSLPLKHA